MKRIIILFGAIAILILLVGCTAQSKKAATGLTVTQYDINGKIIREDTYSLNSVVPNDIQSSYQLSVIPKKTIPLIQIDKAAVTITYQLVFTNVGESYAVVDIDQAYFEYYTT